MDYLEKGSDDNLAAKIRAACQAFEAEDFSADGSGSTPRLNIRTLARHASDPDDSSGGRLARAKKERAEVWQKAVAIRKQHWRIEMWSGWTAKDIKADLVKFRSQSKVQTELNEKHKAFFLSADLLGESNPAWSVGSFEKKHTDRICMIGKVLAELDSESSFTFAFDGRAKEHRTVLEECFQNVNSTEMMDLWISYDSKD